MQRLLLTGVAISALIASPAIAADLARPTYRRPVAVTAPVHNWTVFYVGGNVGYSWGTSTDDLQFFAPSVSSDRTTICRPAGQALCAGGSDSSKLNGAIAGLQGGYNWQMGNFLAGLETDIQISGQKANSFLTSSFPTNDPDISGIVAASHSQRISWFGTARGRAGVLFGNWLLYGTGGLAYGRVNVEGVATATGTALTDPNALHDCLAARACPFLPFGGFSNARIKAGWTAGFGAEAAVSNNWTVKLEYLYVDLGSIDTTFATLPGCYGNAIPTPNGSSAACFRVTPGTGTSHTRVTDNIVRIGLNYKFGNYYAPVLAK